MLRIGSNARFRLRSELNARQFSKKPQPNYIWRYGNNCRRVIEQMRCRGLKFIFTAARND
jgi:hypothetical protein